MGGPPDVVAGQGTRVDASRLHYASDAASSSEHPPGAARRNAQRRGSISRGAAQTGLRSLAGPDLFQDAVQKLQENSFNLFLVRGNAGQDLRLRT